MYNSQVHEKLVKRIWGVADYIRAGLICLGALMIAAVVFIASPWLSQYGLSMITPIVICGAGIGAWYLIGVMRIEYEYTYFNGEFDLDVITAKRKRRRVATVRVREFEQFGKYSELGKSISEMKSEYGKRYFMCSHPQNPDCYYAVFRKEHEIALLVFEPDEELVSEMKKIAPKLFR